MVRHNLATGPLVYPTEAEHPEAPWEVYQQLWLALLTGTHITPSAAAALDRRYLKFKQAAARAAAYDALMACVQDGLNNLDLNVQSFPLVTVSVEEGGGVGTLAIVQAPSGQGKGGGAPRRAHFGRRRGAADAALGASGAGGAGGAATGGGGDGAAARQPRDASDAEAGGAMLVPHNIEDMQVRCVDFCGMFFSSFVSLVKEADLMLGRAISCFGH